MRPNTTHPFGILFAELPRSERDIGPKKGIGDDRLQKKSRGWASPESYTHGTSKQRMRWFMQGFRKGDVREARLLFELPYDRL